MSSIFWFDLKKSRRQSVLDCYFKWLSHFNLKGTCYNWTCCVTWTCCAIIKHIFSRASFTTCTRNTSMISASWISCAFWTFLTYKGSSESSRPKKNKKKKNKKKKHLHRYNIFSTWSAWTSIYFDQRSSSFAIPSLGRNLLSELQDNLQQHKWCQCHSQNGGPVREVSVCGIGRSLIVPNLDSKVHGAIVQILTFPLLRLPLVPLMSSVSAMCLKVTYLLMLSRKWEETDKKMRFLGLHDYYEVIACQIW